MPTHPKLEQYLSRLDKALSQISVSDRSDIITEIKSHIMESQERNPDQEISQILAALGEPEAVANKYLLERGLKPGKPSKSPMVKWLTIGFLGTLGMFFLFTIFMVSHFSPIIKVDEQKGRVQILGGLIDVNEETGSVRVGVSSFSGGQKIVGSRALDKAIKTVSMNFRNAKLEVKTASNQELSWNCKMLDAPQGDFLKIEGDKAVLNATGANDLKCDLEIPASVVVFLDGVNGKVQLDRPLSAVNLKLVNGKVHFIPEDAREYKFQTEVINGKVSGFQSSTNPTAIPINLSLTNGHLSSEGAED